MSSKRPAEEGAEKKVKNAPAVKAVANFKAGTTEAVWKADLVRGYTLRYPNANDCCDAPWSDQPEAAWPRISVPDNSIHRYTDMTHHHIIGGVWSDDDELVAVWGSEVNDGHIELFAQEGYPFMRDLERVTEELNTEICMELVDVFDDGSGIEREPMLVPQDLLSGTLISGLYS